MYRSCHANVYLWMEAEQIWCRKETKGGKRKKSGIRGGEMLGVGRVWKKQSWQSVKHISPDLKAQPGQGTTWQAKWIGNLLGKNKM